MPNAPQLPPEANAEPDEPGNDAGRNLANTHEPAFPQIDDDDTEDDTEDADDE